MKSSIRQLVVFLGIGVMAVVFGLGIGVNSVQAETATGTIESQIFNTGGLVDFGAISWLAATTSTSTITVKVRTDSNSNMSGATDWDSCDVVSYGSDISANNCVTDGERYVQYLVTFSTEYADVSEFSSAELQEVTINYNSMGTLISSPYDTLVTDNTITGIEWSESISGSADVLFQMRTAPDSSGSPGTWSDWMGTSSASDYYTDWEGGETINSAHSDGSNDQWIQYKIYLISDGTNLPVLSDITVSYDADIPIIASISPTSTTTAVSSLDLTINGSDFESGATVTLTASGQTVTATNVTVVSENQITCNLDFSNMPAGRWDVTVTNTNTGTDTLADAFFIEQSTGTITSGIKNLGSGAEFGVITWAGATTSTSTLAMKVRSDSSSDMSGATAWASCDEVNYGADISGNNCVTDGHQYLQYQATLTTNYATSSTYATPELDEVEIIYYTYSSASLTSNYFDTQDIHNVISDISWSETVPGSADVCIQIRTSPGEGGEPTSWSDWIGATGAETCYTTPTGNSIYSAQNDGYDDRWLQYKITLEPDGVNVPILSDLEVTYVTAANTPTVLTSPIAWTGSTVAKGIGRISDDGGGPVSTVGFQYGLAQEPTWSVSKDVYFNNDAFDLVMDNLDKDTKYYFRAFAVNARGTSTGEWDEFTSKATTTLQTIILKTRTILKSNLMLR